MDQPASEVGHLEESVSNLKIENVSLAKEDQTGRIRHCAFCLKPGMSMKVCSGCKRRAYCSKTCQATDWSSPGPGQGHKKWCKVPYCEEDIDWEVGSVPGKGLGIIAKRFIPSKHRIIVEPVFTDPTEHPAIKDLMPVNGTLQEKYQLNCLTGDPTRDFGRPYVALRISRVNHSCDPNAGHNYCETSRVEILYSNRDIKAGEEICFSYRSCNNINPDRPMGHTDPEAEALSIKRHLKLAWGIVCRDDCFCNNKTMKELVVKGRKLSEEIEYWADHLKPSRALRHVKELMAIHDQIHSAWIAKANSHYLAFQVATMSRETLNQAPEHIRFVHDVYSAVCPYSKLTLKYEKEMNHPETALNYLSTEKLLRPPWV